jgi:hypothetical protein
MSTESSHSGHIFGGRITGVRSCIWPHNSFWARHDHRIYDNTQSANSFYISAWTCGSIALIGGAISLAVVVYFLWSLGRVRRRSEWKPPKFDC